MIRRYRYVVILMTLALALAACQLAQPVRGQPAGPTVAAIPSLAANPTGQVTPTEAVTRTEQAVPTRTQAPGKDNPTSVPGQMPPQSQAAGIQPKDMRSQLTHLSNLIGYQVLDENGDRLGIARDYIINTCETYIIYILMEPDSSLNFAPGSRVVIPFEAVTINSGVLDAQKKAIQLHLAPGVLAGAPTLAAGTPLIPPDWESPVQDFWRKLVRIAVLTTRCTSSSGPVYKIADASQLLGVSLYDGRNNLLGVVQEAILEPETGQIGFYVVKPSAGDGLVLVSLGVTNIPADALAPGAALKLVLLADPAAFDSAPRLSNIDQADDMGQQGKARGYWIK